MLLISRLVYGHAIGPVRIAAVAVGLIGVVLVQGPAALSGASLAALLPLAAGAMYAMGNIATKEWCAAESAETLLAGFFAALGVIGLVGMAVLTVFPLEAPAGTGCSWASPARRCWCPTAPSGGGPSFRPPGRFWGSV